MRKSGMVAAVVAAGLLVPSVATADNIRVMSTTDTVDAGLVEGLLRSAYAQAWPGDTISYTGVGTGRALDNARAGQADVVITHAPSLEAQFVNDGYSLGLGRQIFYSDYVIVGSKSDPAGVATKHPNDAVGALEDIAAAGDAVADNGQFYSRADNSGTNVQEQFMWGLSTVAKRKASNAGSDNTRFEPGATVYPAWYKRNVKGQADNVKDVEACAASGKGCYTIVDRGTFNKTINDGFVKNLKIVSQKNATSARGGENLLINPFSAYIVNPAKFPNGPVPNVDAATRFVNFLVSPAFQKSLESFPSAVDPAFLPNAVPSITLDGPMPASVPVNTLLSVAGTLRNRLPGAGTAAGVPVKVQISHDGSTWTDASDTVAPGADGRFRLVFAVGSTGQYRLATGVAPASGYNSFTQGSLDLGLISAQLPKDTGKPLVTHVKVGRTSFSLRVWEATKLRVVIQRRARSGKKLVYKSFQTVNIPFTKSSEKLTVKHKTFARRTTYRLRVTATDLVGNERTVTKTVSTS